MDTNKSNSNNKKRSLEISPSTITLNNFNENGIEKTFNDKYNEFINKDYDSFKLVEIKKYAEELGISNKGRKHEIHERIEQYLLSQISNIEEIKESEEINSFNKGEIQLLIKEIDQTERLFWSIFRNKPIFKEIFSKFKYKRSFTYEILDDIDYILSNFSNGLEILKDKIKSNKHLNPSTHTLTRIIRKDTAENRELLDQIFQKYSKSIFFQDMAKNCLFNGNFFILKYIKANREMLKYVNICSSNVNYRSLKKINFLHELGLYTRINRTYGLPKDFSIFSDFKLKHLIYFIDKLPIFFELDEDYLKVYNDFKSSISQSNISFTNEQLHSTIFQLLYRHSEILIKNENTNNNNDSSSIDKDNIKLLKSNILKYVDFLYPKFLFKDERVKYCLLFKDINQIKSTLEISGSIDIFPSIFFEFFKLKTNMHYDLIKHVNLTINDYWLRIFSKLVIESNDLELIQLAFEKYGDYFKYLEIKSKLSNKDYIEIRSIELLNYFFDNHLDSTDIFEDNNENYILAINLPILIHYEKLMVKLGRKFKFIDYPTYYISNGLNTFELFCRTILNPDAYIVPQDFHFDVEYFMNHGQNIKFEYRFISYLQTRYNNSITINTTIYINTLNSLLENHLKSPITSNDQIFDCEDSLYKIKFYDPWILKEDTKNFKNNGKLLIRLPIENLFRFLYINGRYEEIFQINNSNDWIFGSFEYIIGFFSTKTKCFSKEYIDLLFSHGFKDGKIVNQNFQPKNIFQKLLRENHLSILKLLTLKYKFLFNKKSKSNPDALFDIRQLKDYLQYSISCNNAEITELLLNYVTITKNEYNNIKFKNCDLFKHLYDKFK